MTLEQKYQALLKLFTQVQEFAAVQPQWHFQLHGSKDINEAIQLGKKLISDASQDLLVEESERLELYFAGDSIALHNMG